MSLFELLPFMAIAAAAAAGIVYGLAMAQARVRSLYAERNDLRMRASRQELTIDRLLRRQTEPAMTSEIPRTNRSI